MTSADRRSAQERLVDSMTQQLRESDLMRPNRRNTVLLALAAFMVLGLCFARLFFGVDWTDEAFYAAIPYRFVLGDRPFTDEMNFVQTAGLLEYPLVRVYVALFSNHGLILALRQAYFLFVAGVGIVAFFALRRVVHWPYLLAGGLAYLSLVPLSLPTLSYDTLSAGLLTYGVLFGLRHLLAKRSRLSLLAGGCCHGLAAVAYPPIAVAGPVFAAGMWVAASAGRSQTKHGVHRLRDGLPSALWYGLGFAAVLIVFGVFLLSIGMQSVLDSVSYTRSIATFGGGVDKLRWIAVDTVRLATIWLPLTVPLVAAVVLAGRRRRRLRDVLILLVPASGVFLVVTGLSAPYVSAMKFVILFAVYAWLAVCVQLKGSVSRRILIWWGLVPVTAVGAATAYTSSNGLISAAIGLAPMLLLGSVAASLSNSWAVAESGPGISGRRTWLPVVSAIVLGLVFQWGAVYRDDPVWRLDTRVPTGPYAGMLTTAGRALLSSQLTSDLGELATTSDTVAFYRYFPAGYLFSRLRPCAETVWARKPETAADSLDWYRRRRCYPSLFFRMNGRSTDEPPRLGQSGRYELVRSRDSYRVYRLTTQGGEPAPAVE